MKINLYMLLCSGVLVVLLFSILGINYMPINDGWVSLVLHDSGINIHKLFGRDSGSTGMIRAMWSIPYILADYIPLGQSFTPTLFLIIIDILSGYGIFLLLILFFPDEYLFCALSALLIYYYPADGTMFWLGAFGVNIGLIFCIYSLYFAILSVKNDSMINYVISLVLAYVGSRSYPGHLPVQMTIFLLYFILLNRNNRKIIFMAIGYVALNIFYMYSYAHNAKFGVGREGAVLNLDWLDIIGGFLYAAAQLLFFYFIRLFSFTWQELGVVICCTSVASFVIYVIIKNKHETKIDVNFSSSRLLRMAISALAIFVSGYSSYSIAVTAVRIGYERQLLYARAGVVILFVGIVFYLIEKFSIHKNVIKFAFSVVVLFLTFQAKATVAYNYAAASEAQRFFLGELAEYLPNIEDGKKLLFYIEPSDIVVNKYAAILINRPHFPVRYLYRDSTVDACTITLDRLKRRIATTDGEHVFVDSKSLALTEIIALSYSFNKGFSGLKKLSLGTNNGLEEQEIFFPEASAPANRSTLTSRQQWFINERDRLRTKMEKLINVK